MGQQRRGRLEATATIITIVVGLIAIWQFVLPLIGFGPVQTASPPPTQGPQATIPAFTFAAPTQPAGGGELAAPSGLQLSGSCASGFVLTWDPVPGATRYMIERDGDFAGSETQPVHEFQAFPDGKQHRFAVIAQAFPAPDSLPSAPITAQACTF